MEPQAPPPATAPAAAAAADTAAPSDANLGELPPVIATLTIEPSMPPVKTVEDVMALTKPTEAFVCPLDANKYGVEFIGITMVDGENPKREVHHSGDSTGCDVEDFIGMLRFLTMMGDDSPRVIEYELDPSFLDLRRVQITTAFKVHGKAPLPNLRMIERHYHKDALLKSYDFTFPGPSPAPGEVATWTFEYELPEISPEEKQAMIANPGSVESDSFYFVDGELQMHHKAIYLYTKKEMMEM